ncbi:hypothetical protein [uncultured Bradyrhizobium sp.]|jgi:hypothetical protein|uniref:hypothetical protein n=1 Tax=uncultured Bradyrhizobium sp. TaxID=199684 RepID=UPI00263093B1|nr:hypothetical protein [uncultured Bradyrhizobium sp.]
MIALALAGLLGFATVPAASPAPMVEQVQFRAAPGGRCPDGYDFNHSNGRCYPNGYHAPGVYTRNPGPHEYYGNYGGYGGYGRRGGLCPDGFAYNYADGQCYRNGRQPPGLYGR